MLSSEDGAERDGPSRTTRVLLVRHGESTWNADGKIQGQEDPPLSELGKRQADAVSDRLRTLELDAVYCSPARRSLDTAQSIARFHDLEPRTDAALLEVHLGDWQGRSTSDLVRDPGSLCAAWRADPSSVRPPNGESLSDTCARVAPAMESILMAHQGGTVVMVCHSISGRIVLLSMLGAQPVLVPRLRLKKGAIAEVGARDGEPVLERFNDTRHLRRLRRG